MQSAVTQLATPSARLSVRLDLRALSVWGLCFALILYLGLDGGGYALATHSQVGIVVWWAVIVFGAWGFLPAGSIGRLGVAAITMLAAFVAWTALATTWSISTGRSLNDLTLVSCYLGLFVLGIAVHRSRGTGMKHTIDALASAIVVVCALSLASRLWPHLFASSRLTAQFLHGSQARLAWPLDYWNGLAALAALGLPLLLSIASSARTLQAQALAAGSLPLVATCGALTLSRGGVVAGAVAVVVFMALAPQRFAKLATVVVAAGASAILIAGAFHRHALQQGLANAAERHQAGSFVLAVVIVCLATGVAQLGIGLAARHGTLPRTLRVSPTRARWAFAGALVVLVVIALAAGAPGKLSTAWHDFKSTAGNGALGASPSRFGSVAGNDRYQYWQVAVKSTGGHVLGGSGPGTYQLLWLPRAPFASYVTNAHSLYFETLAEEGAVGLGLLILFFVLLLAAGIRLVARHSYEQRTRAAAFVAVTATFMVSASFDWVWQIPVLPGVVLLLAGPALIGDQSAIRRRGDGRGSGRSRLAFRASTIVLGVGCILATAFPLATSTAIAQSQAAAVQGNTSVALADALEAARIEPGSASAQLQVALVLELGHDVPGAVAAAKRAVADDPQNWSDWLTLSRLYVEAGRPAAAVRAYEKAKSLNRFSSIFQP